MYPGLNRSDALRAWEQAAQRHGGALEFGRNTVDGPNPRKGFYEPGRSTARESND